MLLPPALGFSPHPPVSVYGTGPYRTIAAFLDSQLTSFATLLFAPHHVFALQHGFSCATATPLVPGFPFPALALCLCPHSSVYTEYRNLYLLSIDYGFRPRLRSRLTQGRSALPWKPWIFGRKDSHLPLATHSGILSWIQSTAPYRYSFFSYLMLLYQRISTFPSFGVVFQPRTFSAQDLSTSELLRTL